jgi:peroxiredoxin
MEPGAFPPETLEGWYALHQVFSAAVPQIINAPDSKPEDGDTFRSDTASVARPNEGGWSVAVELIGSRADFLVAHFRPSLDAIKDAERESKAVAARRGLTLVYSFLSVTEAGLYHLTAQLAREASAREGSVGDEVYRAELAARVTAERENPQVRRRLYPERPSGMPYVCFYPMSKRREAGQNWYTLSLDDRSRLMQAHGQTGRRYAGRILQIITGAIGLDDWEWGVTLFAKDPLDFKRLVTDMRFDEVSAKYAEFGEFFVGKVVE